MTRNSDLDLDDLCDCDHASALAVTDVLTNQVLYYQCPCGKKLSVAKHRPATIEPPNSTVGSFDIHTVPQHHLAILRAIGRDQFHELNRTIRELGVNPCEPSLQLAELVKSWMRGWADEAGIPPEAIEAQIDQLCTTQVQLFQRKRTFD